MLRVRDLRVDKAGKTICCVPRLDVHNGERVGVIGPNGSGKTTLLRVASGLERAFTGECQADVALRKRVYVHQSPYLFRGSVLSNVRYGLAARKVSRREQTSTASKWLHAFGVGHLARRRCEHLSGGEGDALRWHERSQFSQALLLIDEPFADLDQDGINIVGNVLCEESDATILISSPVPLSLPVRSYQIEPE